MNKNTLFLWALAIFVCFSSCEEKGSTMPSLSNVAVPVTAHFGDSVPFSLTANCKENLSSITAKIHYGDGKVLEQLFPVSNTGTFTGKLYMPYFTGGIGNSVSVTFSVKNRLFEFYDLPGESIVQLSYPDFPYMTLETDFGEFRMERVGSTSQYKATGIFKDITIAKISSAPAGDWGNVIHFGYSGENISGMPEYAGVLLDSITFQGASDVTSDILFDIATLSPTPIPVKHFISFADSNSQLLDLGKGDFLEISGLSGFSNYWINPSFFSKNSATSLRFEAMAGTYKITAIQPEGDSPYLNVEPWNKETDQPLAFDPATGNGAIWVNGAGGIGIPSTTNAPRWDLTKSFAMAPKGNKKYEMQLVVGTGINSTNTNFKLYGQYNSEDYMFTADPEIIVIDDPTGLNMLYVANTYSENGNIKGRAQSVAPLPSGKTVIITVDASTVPVVLTYEFK